MGSRDEKPASSGFFSAIRNWGTVVHKSVNGYEDSLDPLFLFVLFGRNIFGRAVVDWIAVGMRIKAVLKTLVFV